MKPLKYLRLVLIAFLLSGMYGCNDSRSNIGEASLSGVAQKGSYEIDSSISFLRLSSAGVESIESFDSKIKDKKGGFSVSLPWNDWTKMTVTGLFFNELTGGSSSEELSLKNITDIGDSSGNININILTHMVAARMQKLVDSGQLLAPSKLQAEKELEALLGVRNFEKLNLGSDSQRDNAILLLFSSGFLASSDKGLSVDLLKLTDDFADNGKLDGEATALFQKISIYAGKFGVFDALSQNLKKQGYDNPPTAKTLGVLPAWIYVDKSKNRLPIANAGADKTIIEGQSITLKGSGVDNDGQIKAYLWKHGDTELAQIADLSLSNLPVGKYTYTLIVTDNKNATGSDTVEVTVEAKPKTNQAPTANAGADKTIVEGQSITLKGSGDDSDGQIKSYLWKRGDTELSQTADLSLSSLPVGKYTYTLIVTDNKNATGLDTVEVTIEAKPKTNQAPTANAGADKSIIEGQSITLKGSGVDNDGQIKAYLWKHGDTELAQTADLSLASLSVGKYTYTLIVTDDKGATGSNSMVLSVESKSVETGDINVNLHDELCRTVAGIHLKLISTVTGGVTGEGPVYITQYSAADCSGAVLAPPLPFGLPSETIATYAITDVKDAGGGKRSGLMTVVVLGQQRSSVVNIGSDGNVTR